MSDLLAPRDMIRGPDWQPTLDDPEIQEYLLQAAGDDGLDVFKYILENEPVTGEEIQEAFEDRKPSAVRKSLYALMQEHALEYHKDTDSKGWETFTWATDLPEIKLIHLRRWREEAKDITKMIRILEDHEYYVCPKGHQDIMFEDALDLEFKCPECDQPMSPIDETDRINELKERLDALTPAIAD